jgi:hypothetical protein
MANYAKIENDLVVQVIVAEQDYIDTLDGEWVQTSYNTQGGEHKLGGTPVRKNYAGIGYSYDRVNDAFIPPKPFASWTLNQDTYLWEAPTSCPDDGKGYGWDETTTSWIEVPKCQ